MRLLPLIFLSAAAWAAPAGDGWISLFDGKTLNGWTANAPGSFRVEQGAIVASGPTSHLFYSGPVNQARFRNFELKAEVMTRPGANSGIYFATAFQAKGWPQKGFEVQVNNTHVGEGGYRENKKTGSLYAVQNVYKASARDNEWFPMEISVHGKRVQIKVNGVPVVDYVEPTPPMIDPEWKDGRVIEPGTFALQAHDPKSTALFRNIQVKPLGDDASDNGGPVPKVDELYKQFRLLGAANVPMVDYHVHLKGGLTYEQAIEHAHRDNVGYGVAVNCGKGFPIESDAGIEAFAASMKDKPVFVAMQAEGREWVTMFSPEAVARFDYVFTDGMTWTDDEGHRMRLWMKNEVYLTDKQKFMDLLVKRIVGILDNEPVDLYVNPTFLPDVIAAEYDALWTAERMDKVVEALKRNGVAMEINNRYRIPSAEFIKRAKAAGVKFSIGTNNGGAEDIGRMEYALQMIRECDLKWGDFFVPKPDGEKPVQKKGLNGKMPAKK